MARPKKENKTRPKQVRVYLNESYAQVVDFIKNFTGKSSDSEAINVLIADLIARGLDVRSLRREYEAVEDEIIANYKASLLIKKTLGGNTDSPITSDAVLDHRYHPEPTEGMDHIYLKPIPADWFKAVKCGATGIYKLERQYVRDERFLKPPAKGEHNPYFPDPDKVMMESGGGEVWRIKRSGTWTYFIKLSTGYYFCDWNGYRMGDYMNLGVDSDTERDDFPHLFANFSRQAKEQLEDDIMDAKDLSDYSDVLQPVVTPDYQYYNTSETLTFLT